MTTPNEFINGTGRVWAAPLAGYSDQAWRVLARRLGADIVFSEMVSVEGLIRSQRRTTVYLENPDEARPFALQLFGTIPESFAEAIGHVDLKKVDLIDVNAGCPVKKVIKKGAGSALMRTPDLIGEIVRAIRKNYKGLLSVKIRSGWDSVNAVEVAKIIESAGADAVIVHARTAKQVFTGHADWNVIKMVRDAVKIFVVGNGDIKTREDAARMFSETGCNAVMVGRAAIPNPWIFREISNGAPVSPEEKFKGIREHIALLQKFYGEHYTMTATRKFVAKYLKGIRGAKPAVQEIYHMKKMEDVLERLELFERGDDK